MFFFFLILLEAFGVPAGFQVLYDVQRQLRVARWLHRLTQQFACFVHQVRLRIVFIISSRLLVRKCIIFWQLRQSTKSYSTLSFQFFDQLLERVLEVSLLLFSAPLGHRALACDEASGASDETLALPQLLQLFPGG